jgi:DNA-binding MarR family transcriptional regulator
VHLKPKSKEFSEYLERSRAIRTLLCLLNAKNKGLDELLSDIGGSKSTGMARIDELIRLGLVLKTASQTEKRKMLYCLNEKGKGVAEQIQQIIESVER